MKIAIDVTRAVIEGAGIGRYTYETVSKILDIDRKNSYIIFSTHFNSSSQKTKIFQSFNRSNVTLKRFRIPGRAKEILWGMKLPFFDKFLEKADILYAPSYFEVLLGSKIAQVVTIHDMTANLFPNQRGKKLSEFLSKRTLLACQKAKFITCVSKSTQNDLIRLDKINQNKTQVIYPGLKVFGKVKELLPNGLKKQGYILSVGTIEPRKNIAALLRAYNTLEDSLKEKFPLVLVGGRGWNDSEIFEEAGNKALKKHILFTGYVDDATLAGLYKYAKVFVYPSLYEGFGLPILEAMSFSCPVITSNISSMPEVAGECAVLIDPKKIPQIADALKRLIEDKNLAGKLSECAKRQSEKFSWEQTAKQTLEVFEKQI